MYFKPTHLTSDSCKSGVLINRFGESIRITHDYQQQLQDLVIDGRVDSLLIEPEDGFSALGGTRAIKHRRAGFTLMSTYFSRLLQSVEGDRPFNPSLVISDARTVETLSRLPWEGFVPGSELAGQRAAVVMSLLQSAKLHGHDPWAYLKDVLTRLPGHMNSRIDELLPHRWQPQP